MKKIPCRMCGKLTKKTFCSRKCILEYKKALKYASDNPKPKYDEEEKEREYEYKEIKKLRVKNDERLLKEINQK
jgi:hypothetical protein